MSESNSSMASKSREWIVGVDVYEMYERKHLFEPKGGECCGPNARHIDNIFWAR